MERYNKYLVLKNEDIAKHLSDEKQLKLDALVTNIRVGRLQDGKRDQEYVVVAADWPMYETVWGLVEAFVDNKPNEIDQLRARVAALEAEVSRLKTVPMKYRRMQFNAELQEQVARLEAQLAETEALEISHGERIEKLTKLLLLAKGALEYYSNESVTHGTKNTAAKALAAINDSKLVEGLILCDAEPVAYADLYGNVIRKDTKELGRSVLTNDFSRPLYAPRRTAK